MMEKPGTSKSLWISTVRMCKPVREALCVVNITAKSSISATEEPHLHKLVLEDAVAKMREFRRDAVTRRHRVVTNRNKLAKSGQFTEKLGMWQLVWRFGSHTNTETREGMGQNLISHIKSTVKLRLTTHICTVSGTSTRKITHQAAGGGVCVFFVVFVLFVWLWKTQSHCFAPAFPSSFLTRTHAVLNISADTCFHGNTINRGPTARVSKSFFPAATLSASHRLWHLETPKAQTPCKRTHILST